MAESKDYKTLHHQAMELCDSAERAERLGQPDVADRDWYRAFETEVAAAKACPMGLEPTRSVIHRSAASLGLQIATVKPFIGKDHLQLVRSIVMDGLAGDPPAEIIKELLDTLGDLPLRKAAHKLVDSVDRCVDDNTAMRRNEVADRLTYVLMLLEKS